MAWATLRTLYVSVDRNLTVILGAGGAPNVSLTTSRGLAVRYDGAAGSILYETADSGSTWATVGSGSTAIADTGNYYTVDTISGATDELATQLGGDTSSTYNFAENNVLTDDDAVYAALNKLDLKWGDLASTSAGEGATLVALRDAGTNYASATVEAAFAELAAATGAAIIGIADASGFYTGDDVETALNEIEAAIGGTSSTVRAYTENNVITDDESHTASLEKLDLKWGDLASTAGGEGASLVGINDAGSHYATATVEAALQEIAGAGFSHVDLIFDAASDVTIAVGGAATLTQAVHTIRGNGAAPDDCDTISGMTNAEVAILVTGAEAITYRDAAVGGGNIATHGNTSIVTATGDLVIAVLVGSVVHVCPLSIAAGMLPGHLALARGSVIAGNASAVGAAVSIAAADTVAIGDGTDVTTMALPTSGLVAKTALNAATGRTISDAVNGGITVTNGDGVAGNPTLAVNLNDLAGAVIDPAADSIAFLDATDNSTKLEAVADLVGLVAGNGLAAASGVLSVDVNELSDVAMDLAADSVVIHDATDNSSKRELWADIAAGAAGDGIQAAAGVLAVDVSDFAGTGLEDDGSENLRIAAAAAGDGLQGGAGSALAVDVSDFAGTGLEDDGSENLRLAEWVVYRQVTAIAGGDGAGNVGDLNSTPVTVINAPGSNKIAVPMVFAVKFTGATAAYDNAGAGNDIVFRYQDGAQGEVSADIDNGNGGAIRLVRVGAGTDYAVVHAGENAEFTPEVNSEIEVYVRTADPYTAAGDVAMTVYAYYRVVDVS